MSHHCARAGQKSINSLARWNRWSGFHGRIDIDFVIFFINQRTKGIMIEIWIRNSRTPRIEVNYRIFSVIFFSIKNSSSQHSLSFGVKKHFNARSELKYEMHRGPGQVRRRKNLLLSILSRPLLVEGSFLCSSFGWCTTKLESIFESMAKWWRRRKDEEKVLLH